MITTEPQRIEGYTLEEFITPLERGANPEPFCDWLEGQGLLTTAHALDLVLHHPHVTGLRLVYARACELAADENVPCPACSGEGCSQHGHGDISKQCNGSGTVVRSNGLRERAEFIRVQCEIASVECKCQECHGPASQIPAHLCILKLSGLRRREQELWKAHGKVWLKETLSVAGIKHAQTPAINSSNGLFGVWSADDQNSLMFQCSFARGFVESVQCTSRVLLGGDVCEGCDGIGDDAGRLERHTVCPSCNGTGTTPGILADLFAAAPVLEVKTELRPAEIAGEFSWCRRESETHSPWFVPPAVFDVMVGDSPGLGDGIDDIWKAFATADAAKDAESNAWVRLGRSKAKLPELEKKT